MAEYYINNTPISQFGIIPIKANGNIAISGCFNLPKRKGTTYYDWLLDDSVEPYDDDIVFDSREIMLFGIISSESEKKLAIFEKFSNNLPEIFSLSCKWGEWNVKFKGVNTETITKTITKVTLKFTEPKFLKFTWLPESGGEIDGKNWKYFGLTLKSISNYQGIGERKSLNVTQNPSYSIPSKGGIGKTEITVEATILASDTEEFKDIVIRLYNLFGSPGLRTIQYRGRIIKCFCSNGFAIQNVFSIGKVYANFSCKLIVVSNERI